MQNTIDPSDEFISQSDNECDKQFSQDVIRYQNRVEDIIAWLFGKEEELQRHPHESSLQDAPFCQVLEEYSKHERFISEFCEYCHTIMKCKEDGQEMRENEMTLTEEDRDEVGIQMDAMMVCYEKLKILSTDRLRNLQRIVEERQQTKIERFEEWLSAIEMKMASSTSIGPNYEAIERQLGDLESLRAELEQKQDFLNFMSSVIIFDDVDSESLQIRSKSCESLDERLENMNRRWTDICRFVDDRADKLKKAESIWKLLIIEEPQLTNWLRKIERSLLEVSEAVRNQPDVPSDKVFIAKLLSRSDKIDLEIKSKQSFYTGLESRVRAEIEKFDDPCSMLVIELEKKLEGMQDNWNAIMNRKRMLDYSLQALSNPISNQINMIPLPEPITYQSSSDTGYNNPDLLSNSYATANSTYLHADETVREHLSNSSSSGNDEKDSSFHLNGSYSDSKAFDNSLSSTTRSLLYGNNLEQDPVLYKSNNNNNMNSRDDLSSPSMTTSYPINMMDLDIQNNRYPCFQTDTPHQSQHRLLSEHAADMKSHEDELRKANTHSCRVEEWRHSLESFSTWLKRVETSLCITNSLDSNTESNDERKNWSRLDVTRQLLLLNEVESQIVSTCQDEFDCLILHGQQIIEDLIPEIGENEYEANLKEILADLEIRYSTVKRWLDERRRELASKERWLRLLKTLQGSCHYLIEQMEQVIPETNIGLDLITLAQQQDLLMHSKADLEDNAMLHDAIQEAKLFLNLCDTFQQQTQAQSNKPPIQLDIQHGLGPPTTITSNNDIWLSFKNLKEDIESQLDRLTLHYSELSQLIEDRLIRLNEVHKEMHSLQHKMQELASKLQLAEILKSNWVPLENLSIEKLSEQLEDLKLFRERITETASIHKVMNSIFDWMTTSDVPLSQQNLKRISELNTIWSLIQVSVEERQKLIEQAFDNQGASEQKFLTQTVADLPRWERRVATSRVPYFIDHNTSSTNWDHPKFTDFFKTMSNVKHYVYSAYRTAIKLRHIQRKFGLDMLMLEQLKELLDLPYSGLGQQPEEVTESHQPLSQTFITNNETQVGVEQIIFYLKVIYEKIQNEENPSLDVPLSIDLTLNWLLNLYDSARTGRISALALKVGLTLICCATREEKYTFMFELVSNQTGSVDARKLGTLFELCMRIPMYLGEGESFGGPDIIETSIRSCFSMSKFNPQHPNSIDLCDYLNWLKSEPKFIIWVPVLHRLLISENTSHDVKCKLCKMKPIIGLRYRCLKCFKFNICQNCFLTGRHLSEHYDPNSHPMQEYLYAISSGENVRDLTKILRNKLKTNPAKKYETNTGKS